MAEKKQKAGKKDNKISIKSRNLRLSTKASITVCKKINSMNFPKGKSLLEDMVSKKRSINGKYYTNVSRQLLKIMNLAESNAEFRGLDTSRLFTHASAGKGFNFRTPRRFKLRRKAKKLTNIEMVVEQR